MANIAVTCIFMVLVDRLTVDYDIIYCLSVWYNVFPVNLYYCGNKPHTFIDNQRKNALVYFTQNRIWLNINVKGIFHQHRRGVSPILACPLYVPHFCITSIIRWYGNLFQRITQRKNAFSFCYNDLRRCKRQSNQPSSCFRACKSAYNPFSISCQSAIIPSVGSSSLPINRKSLLLYGVPSKFIKSRR